MGNDYEEEDYIDGYLYDDEEDEEELVSSTETTFEEEEENIRSNVKPKTKGEAWKYLLSDISIFSAAFTDKVLYPYQLEVARAIVHSVVNGLGHNITVMFSRQAGKNEVSAQVEAYLMALHMVSGGSMVKAAPTYKPQIVNSRMRVESILTHPLLVKYFRPRAGYIFMLGNCYIMFFSAGKQSQIVGATAKTLLEVDEAQDVSIDKFEKDLSPMGATSNVTTVFYGTAWTKDTLLEKKIQHNLILEKEDGIKRHFEFDADVVGQSNPSYKQYVAQQVSEKGREHPIIRTQYYLERLDALGKLFTEQRKALLQGNHTRTFARPMEGNKFVEDKSKVYVAVIDHAGEDEEDKVKKGTSRLDDIPKRDSTICAIAELDFSRRTKFDHWPYLKILDFKVLPTGAKMLDQQMELLGYLDHWKPQAVVTDAIGVGEGPSAFLQTNYKGCWNNLFDKYHANSRSKSDAGFDMIAMIDTGHFKMFADDGTEDWKTFWKQIDKCKQTLMNEQIMNFYVDQKDGHDDFISCLHFLSRIARKYRDNYLWISDVEYTDNIMEVDKPQDFRVLPPEKLTLSLPPPRVESFFNRSYDDGDGSGVVYNYYDD